MKWTDAEITVLRKCAEKGLRAKDVARILKSRTEDSIINKASGMGIPLGGLAPEIDLEAFTEMTGEVIEG